MGRPAAAADEGDGALGAVEEGLEFGHGGRFGGRVGDPGAAHRGGGDAGRQHVFGQGDHHRAGAAGERGCPGPGDNFGMRSVLSISTAHLATGPKKAV